LPVMGFVKKNSCTTENRIKILSFKRAKALFYL
jgi:hypothetical protein